MDENNNEKARRTRNKKRGITINEKRALWKGQGKREHNKELKEMWQYEKDHWKGKGKGNITKMKRDKWKGKRNRKRQTQRHGEKNKY